MSVFSNLVLSCVVHVVEWRRSLVQYMVCYCVWGVFIVQPRLGMGNLGEKRNPPMWVGERPFWNFGASGTIQNIVSSIQGWGICSIDCVLCIHYVFFLVVSKCVRSIQVLVKLVNWLFCYQTNCSLPAHYPCLLVFLARSGREVTFQNGWFFFKNQAQLSKKKKKTHGYTHTHQETTNLPCKGGQCRPRLFT